MGSLLDVLSDFRDKKAMDEFFFNRQHYTWGPIYKLNISKYKCLVSTKYANSTAIPPCIIIS